MRYQIAHSIQEVDETHWDAIAGDKVPMTHRWQRVMEAGWRNYLPRYLMLADNHGPLAIAVAEIGRAFGYTGWRKWLLKRLTLVVGVPFSSLICGVMVRSGVEPAAVLPRLTQLLGQICQRERRVLLGVSNVSTGDIAIWQAMNFSILPLQRAAVLDLPPDYERYLQALSREERSRLRRLRRRGEACGVTFEHGPLAGDGERIYPLLCEVFSQHGNSLAEMPFTAEFFSILEREIPGKIQLFRGFVNGELAGVSLGILTKETLWGPMIGLRYELARPSYLYFLLIDEVIRWSIAHRLRRIYGGLTSEREKQEQGFHLQERWFCCRAQPALLNIALKGVVSLARHAMPRSAAAARDA